MQNSVFSHHSGEGTEGFLKVVSQISRRFPSERHAKTSIQITRVENQPRSVNPTSLCQRSNEVDRPTTNISAMKIVVAIMERKDCGIG